MNSELVLMPVERFTDDDGNPICGYCSQSGKPGCVPTSINGTPFGPGSGCPIWHNTVKPRWESIDNAPLNGTNVLVFNGEVGVGYFCEFLDENKSRWEWCGEGFEINPPPTHWMPLPVKP